MREQLSKPSTTTPPSTPEAVSHGFVGRTQRKPENGSSKDTSSGCPTCDNADRSLLEEEAAGAIREVSFAVQNIAVSEMLPRTTELLFLNITTLEGTSYCIELTAKGWRIASNRFDCMNGDFRKIDTHTRYFETIYALLDHLSPEYRNSFGARLISQLNDLKSKIGESRNER